MAASEDDQLPLMLCCWCPIDVLMVFFFVSHCILTRMNNLVHTFQGNCLVLTYLCFCIKYSLVQIFFTLSPNFCISFLIFGLIFGIQRRVIFCFLLVLLSLLLLLVPQVFFSKLLIIFCNVLLPCLLSLNVSLRYSIFALKCFSEQILVALAINLLNTLVIV